MTLAECEYRHAQDAFSKRYITECLQFLHRAERAGYPPDECAACRWQCWMLLGRFDEAWRESDAIAGRGRADPGRLWDGQPFTGKRVMIRCLHGYGDALQFIRYAGLLRRQAAAVLVQTHPQLVSLLKAAPFADGVTTWTDGPGRCPGDWDQQIEVMELPRAFRTTVGSIPAEVPYVSPPPALERESFQRLGPRFRPRVGLVWEGGGWDAGRNVPLSELLPILQVPGVEFVSFQRGAAREELAARDPDASIRDLSGDSEDVSYFAADLMHTDLLITVDTMAAHLAGALGRPVWVLLPYQADWRWMLDRPDTPWYPTMRLFRQRAPGDWRRPVREAASELSKCFGQCH
jgi:hypothetical protein